MRRYHYLGLAPWLVFVLADRASGLGPAPSGLLALAVAAGVTVHGIVGGRRSLLPVAAMALFAVLAVVTVVLRVPDRPDSVERPLSLAVLAVLLVIMRRVDPEGMPLQWPAAVAGCALMLSVGTFITGDVVTTAFDWLLPAALLAAAEARARSRVGGPRPGEDAPVPLLLDGLLSAPQTGRHGAHRHLKLVEGRRLD